MRRLSLVLVGGAFLLAGCNALRDAFSGRAETVARAHDQTLSVGRVGAWAGSGEQGPRDPQSLSRLAHVWGDYALLGQALAAGGKTPGAAAAGLGEWPPA